MVADDFGVGVRDSVFGVAVGRADDLGNVFLGEDILEPFKVWLERVSLDWKGMEDPWVYIPR